MSRLNDVYNDKNNSDNDVINRVLNTFIESDDSIHIYISILEFVLLFYNLQKTSDTKRYDIKYIVDKILYLETKSNNFEDYIAVVKEIYKLDFQKNYKYLFVMCFCRSMFDLFFDKNICYKKPEYATMEAIGEESWHVFLKSLETNDYVYMQNKN